MAKVALRKPRGRMSQVIGSLVIASLMFGFAIMANAQNTTPGKPKVAVVKPEEKKTEPKTVTPEPKTTTPEPSKNEPSVPAANVGTSPGFGPIEEPVKIINEYFANSWKENSIQPAARCDDYEFARRAFLDIIGRIPTVAEIDQYIKDPPATRRGQLLDRLLTGELKGAYASNWATIWTNWLMTRTGPNLFKQQIHLWLEEAFSTENPVDGTAKPHMSY
ncbi:MAG: DUF1549 domain-containing protein, partial [Planctomycetia bacterium]|nr:DUF1549 domain-containing protein [Planctomycetia bacterium]